jgi:hypothetical protein
VRRCEPEFNVLVLTNFGVDLKSRNFIVIPGDFPEICCVIPALTSNLSVFLWIYCFQQLQFLPFPSLPLSCFYRVYKMYITGMCACVRAVYIFADNSCQYCKRMTGSAALFYRGRGGCGLYTVYVKTANGPPHVLCRSPIIDLGFAPCIVATVSSCPALCRAVHSSGVIPTAF